MKQGKLFLDTLVKPFRSRSQSDGQQQEVDLETIAAQEQMLFSYTTLVAATRDFHLKHKLGEGGFGPVYKGVLDDGRVVAVKKLSQSSSQGKKEFLNEAKLLARVQHRNVVNLLGYCVHGADKILVYEYVAHESLDKFLFDARKRDQLNWKRRYDIILGVARGLLYLHEDAHSRIIHRDIKASNILLDDKWVPKIADFGMARLFPEDQTHVNTRVAGTNGYMAPEYVMHGRLSVKADVFSFGVVVLELVCGKKNSTFGIDSDGQSLLEWAWRHYKRGRSLEVIDPSLASTEDMEQVAMCIQIGLLCCQADPVLRPTIRRVVVMLSKRPGALQEPTKPGCPVSRHRRSRPSGSLTTSFPSSSSNAGESSRAASSSNTGATATATNSTSTLSPTGPPPPHYGASQGAAHKHKLKDKTSDSS